MTGPGRAIRTRAAGAGCPGGYQERGWPHEPQAPEPTTSTRASSRSGTPRTHAAGPTAVAVTMKRAVEQMGVRRATQTLLKLNQVDGFDCPGCAWPDPTRSTGTPRSSARTAPRRSPRRPPCGTIGREFFAAHPLAELRRQDRLLAGPAGPAHRADGAAPRAAPTTSRSPGTTRSTLIARAAARPGQSRTRPSSTPRAGPPTRRRSSTSCSRARSAPTTCPTAPTCATSPRRSALAETIGIGKGSVTLEDVHTAELIVIVGQNPGTNHPRMLTALEKAKKNGAKIIVDQPAARGRAGALQEPADARAAWSAGAPRWPTCTCRSGSTATSRCSRRIGALLLGVGRRRPRLRRAAHHAASRSTPRTSRDLDWDEVVRRAPASTREQIEEAAAMFRDSAAHRHLLGDGPHPAPQRGRHHPGDRQRRAAAGQHRQARRRALPGARPLQRAGRPHHGHLGAARAGLPRRAARRVRLRAAARARLRHRRGDPGAARRRGQGVLRDGRQLRLRRLRHRRHRGGHAQRRADRARLDQAQPLARRARPRRR